MDLVELNKIFDVKYGNKFDANKMTFLESGSIHFITRTSKNNGSIGPVMKYNDIRIPIYNIFTVVYNTFILGLSAR